MPEWTPSTATTDPAEVTELREQLTAVSNQLEVVSESFVSLQLAAEDAGWQQLGQDAAREFDRTGLDQVSTNCRVMAVASPLIKRGLAVRAGYIWGGGVSVDARDAEVAATVAAFWDDESNQAALTSSQAQEENERVLGTDGNFFLALFTNRITGRVQVRSTPFSEVRDVIRNPEDRDEAWFYRREYTTTVVEAGYAAWSTRTRTETRKVLHPALGYRPRTRPRTIDGVPVEWDQPMIHVAVNRLDGAKWGVPDAYAALPWARAYEGFLTDWAKLMKSLSRFAWRLTGDRASKAQRAARAVAGALPVGVPPVGSDAGAAAVSGPGAHLEAIPKSGATIDSESGRPLAAMVASGLGLPVTMLLADPGTTGARAVAETLDKPTQNEMNLRRSLWGSVLATVAGYVIDQAVRAPQGMLRGLVQWDQYTDRERVTLEQDPETNEPRDRSVTVTWPEWDTDDLTARVAAIVDAHSTDTIPPREVARLLLLALEVEDVDDVIEGLFDDDGQWAEGKAPVTTAGAAALRGFDRGETADEDSLGDEA